MSSNLKDKVAIITGSSSGIGEAIAVLLASRGAKVTLCGRDQGRLDSVLDKVVKANGGHRDRVIYVQGDLNDDSVQKKIIDTTVKTFGGLDILVANAGMSTNANRISTASQLDYDLIMNTNLRSVFFLIQKAVPHLEKSKGNIVNISSIASTIIAPAAAVYSMSKAALDHLTKCLAVDLGSKGIRVNSVNPGYVTTRILRTFTDDIDKLTKTMEDLTIEKQPLKVGRGLRVEDLAEATAFLVSEAAGFITGEILNVDGGFKFTGTMQKE